MGKKNPKISIIVPVYNTEKYIRRCIDSILFQSFEDFELLLIDDGSTDSSGKICDEYARKDSRIRVFHKLNGGVSSTRQMGVELARGFYSIHIDSDDYVETSMLYEMYDAAMKDNAEMLVVDFYRDFGNKTIYCKQKVSSNPLKSIEYLIKGNAMGSLCCRLIKHSIYNEKNIKFLSTFNYSEDLYVIIKIMLCLDKISYLNKAFYHYIDTPNSITKCQSKDTYQQRFSFINELSKLLADYPSLIRSIDYLKSGLFTSMIHSHNFTYIEIFSCFYEFKTLTNILKSEKRSKFKLIYAYNDLFILGKYCCLFLIRKVKINFL